MRSPRLLACLAGLLAFALPHAARAQTSLNIVPTAEVMPKGESYVQLDFETRPTSRERGGFQTYGIFYVHGPLERVEVGVNAYLTKDGAETEPVELQSNIKWRLYDDGEAGLGVAVGGIFYAPIGRGGRGDTYGSVYAVVTKRLERVRGAQFTGGAYALVGQGRGAGSRTGTLLGYDQPLGRRLRLLADWNTGRNRLGYASAGFGLTLTEKSALYSAYYFGNEGAGNNYLGVYYGYGF